MHRLVAYAPNGVQRFTVDRADMTIGSDLGCDIHLPYAGVGHLHARLSVSGDRLRIEDLGGSRKGVLVNGERVKDADLQLLDEIRLGGVALLLEDVVPDLPAVTVDIRQSAKPPRIDAERMLEHLAAVSQWVLSDTSSAVTLESLVLGMLGDFGGGVLFLFQGEAERQGIKFVVATDAGWLGHGEEILQQVRIQPEGHLPPPSAAAHAIAGQLAGRPAWLAYRAVIALDRPYLLTVALPAFEAEQWSPLDAFRTLADQLILGLVHHVGQYEPILFGRQQQSDLTLAPGLIAGESPVMRGVLDQLRAAVDLEVPVLLRGEAGVSRELLARSLHLSGPRAAAPFLTVHCGGTSPQQLEASLFGAEVAGKSNRVERVGQLTAADQGIIYLEDVDELPLAVQHRLVRFIRSGVVEPVDSLTSCTVDVRIIASSKRPLEECVARDQFRVDLAYRLSQSVVEVPSIRDRREDLPLLIQVAVNDCCHQSGKRVQGITVKAMESLANHDYPGNLPELESIVRRLVYLCPSGRPIDDSMLPKGVRLSKIRGLRPEVDSELNLERLVAGCERAAIREALRRSAGNKSEASRQLGLSRNGLNMKMKRLGLES